MYVYHVVLNDDELENVKRWADEDNMTVEEKVQSMFDGEMEAELELERGQA